MWDSKTLKMKKIIKDDGEEKKKAIEKMIMQEIQNDMNKKGDMDNGGNEVVVQHNSIYFYCVVEPYSILQLREKLTDLSKSLQCFSICHECSPPNINLRISSPGGVLYDGFNAVDLIKRNIIPVYTHIEGIAASAASLMSVVGRHRTMTENSTMLIHQLSTGVWGTFHNLKDEYDNCEKLMKMLKTIYDEHAKMPQKILNRILKHDLLLDSRQCLKFGLIDEIL